MLSTLRLPFLAFAVLAALCAAGFWYSRQADATAGVEVRWLVAHQPSSVFENAEKLLAQELSKRSGNAYRVTFLTPEDMGLGGVVSPESITELLRDGKVDLVSMNVDSIIAQAKAAAPGEPLDLEVLHLPYLFRDYASADRVIDGAVGAELLNLLDEAVPGKALAFTYSGGFRVVASQNPLASAEDLKGQRINTWGSATMQESLRGMGAVPVAVPTIGGGKDRIAAGESDGVEMTYTRAEEAIGAYAKQVLETNHVLFLSALFASDQFYDALSAEGKEVLDSAAVLAAQTERADSIALNEKVRAELIANGVTVTALSASDRSALEQWAQDFRASSGMSEAMRTLEQKILQAQVR